VGLLASLQDGGFSTWIRESSWAMFAFLIVHTISMGFLVGTGATIGLRILGIAPGVPLSRLARFTPVMMVGFVVAVISGVLLLIGYPAKAITNPVFYLKLALLTAAIIIFKSTARRLFSDARFDAGPLPAREKILAAACLLLWAGTLTAGKFLAYTHRVLLLY
jgi:hypothetical protein